MKSIKGRVFLIPLLLVSCSRMDESENEKVRKYNEKKEIIYRLHSEKMFPEIVSKEKKRENYPWEESSQGSVVKLTKEYFRCKGSDVNPPRRGQKAKEEILDCAGLEKHGLPLCDNQEFIYPILIDLLNYVGEKSGKSLVITTGHRCPQHNYYADPSPRAQTSKHQIGAEVDFYVEDYEERPLEIVRWIMDFYQTNQNGEYNRFIKCQKNREGVKHPGWYNKEILLYIHEKNEGRDFDNRHPYPYITIEVRMDRKTSEPVTFDWAKANKIK